MEIRRFFIEPSAFRGDGTAVVDGAEFVHMTRVLRYKPGYKVILCPGDGTDVYGEIAEINGCSAVVKTERTEKNDTELPYSLALFQSLPKGDKSDFIVQKSVELGVSRIVFFTGDFTAEKKFAKERLNRIALEACKQCGRAVSVPVEGPVPFAEAAAMMGDYGCALMAYEKSEGGGVGEDARLPDARSVAVAVGGEGGFSPEEAKAAERAGVRLITLGKRILRCETAAVAALALVNYEKGEMGG